MSERKLIERLVRSLVESADWCPGSAEAREFEYRGKHCWCDGSLRHSAACRRARKVFAEAQALLEKPPSKLERQVAEMREALELCDPEGRRMAVRAPEDPLVLQLCEQWGFGAVMDSAARQWRARDPIAAHTHGPCVATVQDALGARPASPEPKKGGGV